MSYDAFRDVDAAKDPRAFIEYLARVSEHPLLRERARRRAELAGSLDGLRVLDIGCGLGTDCRFLSGLVGANGSVVGIDKSAMMVEAARERTQAANVSYRVGAAEDAELGAGAFDLCWMERTLVHVSEPVTVLRRVADALAPGGRIAVGEIDYLGIMVDCEAEDTDLLDGIVGTTVNRSNNPRIGRSLLRLLVGAGFRPTHVVDELYRIGDFALSDAVIGFGAVARDLAAAGQVDAEALASWQRRMAALSEQRIFTCLIPSVTIVAERIQK